MKLSSKVRGVLASIKYVSVATVSGDGVPWNTAVFTAYDKNDNIFWGSYTGSQHSRNIKATGKVFLLIYDSTVDPGTGIGLYIQASCSELIDPKEIESAHKLLQVRRVIPYWKLEEVQASSPIHLYKAVPIKVWTNGEDSIDGHYIDKRVSAINL